MLVNLVIMTTALIATMLLPRVTGFLRTRLQEYKFEKASVRLTLNMLFFAAFEVATLVNLIVLLSYI